MTPVKSTGKVSNRSLNAQSLNPSPLRLRLVLSSRAATAWERTLADVPIRTWGFLEVEYMGTRFRKGLSYLYHCYDACVCHCLYSMCVEDRIWLWLYCNKFPIVIYNMFYLLKGDYSSQCSCVYTLPRSSNLL